MGAWGFKNFENDGAADFVYDVFDNGKKVIFQAIQKIVKAKPDEYLEAPDCEEDLAAIELLAAAKNNQSSDCNPDIIKWLQKNDVLKFKNGLFGPKVDLVPLAEKALDRIINDSELRELWEESEQFDEWT